MLIRSFHSIHDVVDRDDLQAMWEELAGQVVYRDQNSLSANHAYLITLYDALWYDSLFVYLFCWCLTALSAQIALNSLYPRHMTYHVIGV